MQADDTGGPDRTVMADRLLDEAERTFLKAEFDGVRPRLRHLQNTVGSLAADSAAVRYAVLRAALAARVGNWPEAVRRCPDSDLHLAETGVVHALAVNALRRLGEEGGRHTEYGTAALAIVLWAHLLDEDDPGGFRTLLDGRRGAPVPDERWEEARLHLLQRITDLLHALDYRSGRDVLTAWETAWGAQHDVLAVLLSDAGPDSLIPLTRAARHLVDHDHCHELLDAHTARHPDPATWTADSPDHHAYADALAQAFVERGRHQVRDKKWSEALADFGTAARLGHTPGTEEERAAVLRAGRNVGRGSSGHGSSPVARIHGLELAHALLPEEGSLTAELAAELVRQGRRVFGNDARQSRNRFARALVVSPRDQDARSGLDDHMRADLSRALDGAQPQEEIRVDAVQDLLRRDPECASARKWLRDHYVEQAVTAASEGRVPTARSAVCDMIRHSGDQNSYEEEHVDGVLVDLLIGAARLSGAESTRGDREHRVGLLSAAAAIAGPDRGHVREKRDAAVLDLAEYLEATASPSDVIGLFLQDRLRIGVSARFDWTVETAYLRRAEEREEAGDLGGARRDRACAERIGAGLPDQGLLFGPTPRTPHSRRHDPDPRQGALF
ncbi:hypothetical protein OHB54_13440 [Streptomyces sp. NBC_01007]|nr:hypothetical protein OHB54_13440 [Streptomyces sp. NBC_01007]